MFPWGWTAGYPDALYFLSQVWYGPSRYNRSRWMNAEYDALIDEATTTADAEARYALYHKAEKVLMDDWGTCPLPGRMQIAVVKPNVRGRPPHAVPLPPVRGGRDRVVDRGARRTATPPPHGGGGRTGRRAWACSDTPSRGSSV